MSVKQTIIFGAPGCGKTYYLLNLLEKLLKDYKPYEIAFVSFTRSGAYEGKQRVIDRFGYTDEDLPYFRTLHSLAFTNSELSKIDVMQRKNYKEFSEAMDMRFTGYYTEDFNSNDDLYLFYYFLKKNNPRAAEDIVDTLNLYTYERVARGYDLYKKKKGLIDYTDMLTFFNDRNTALPVKVAIIDEAQDLTTLQWKMCQLAFKDCKHVYIAGDDDQAIYEWNGADVTHFLQLAGDRVILDKSYRMPSKILNFSKNITDLISARVDKKFAPNIIGGDVWTYNDISEVPIVDGETYYFLARNNYHLTQCRQMLRKKAYVYVDKSELSVDTRMIRAITAYERRRKTGTFANDVEALIVDQVMKKDMKHKFEEPWYTAISLVEDEEMYYRDLIQNKTDLSSTKITVNTIHGVKGGEADNVVLLLDFTNRVNLNYLKHKDSELRCLYVACTRAKKRLHIVFSKSQYGFDTYIDFNEFLLNMYEKETKNGL